MVKKYGSITAVDNISINIKAGEFFTILGPSGSGKTTTMMMVAGFVYPNAGTIRIGEKDVANLPPQKRGLGMVFQHYAVFPHLSVFENVAFPLRVRNMPKQQIIHTVGETLALVKLHDYASRMPRELSGGQLQRVALARALAFNPNVLLMDEPLGALDKKLRDHMQAEIRRIHKTVGVTVIYVTHDQSEALTMSDRIAIMNEGRIDQIGSPSDLYDRPTSRFVADFLGDTNFLTGTVVAIDGDLVQVRTDDGFTFRGTFAGKAADVGVRVEAGIRPEKVQIAEAGDMDSNRYSGLIRESGYSGNTLHYCVEGPGGADFIVTAANNMSVVRHNAGDHASLVWESRDTRIFAG
ncbi:ABC transporter ATP-binding protein [Mesorhizobium sp. A623]